MQLKKVFNLHTTDEDRIVSLQIILTYWSYESIIFCKLIDFIIMFNPDKMFYWQVRQATPSLTQISNTDHKENQRGKLTKETIEGG